MDTVGSLLVAFLGAGTGAFFAVVKSRKERLWLDRYQTLQEIVLSLGIIESRFSASHMELLGVSALGSVERKKLSDEWPLAMHSLRQSMSKLQLVFRKELIKDLSSAVQDLHASFTDMHHGEGKDTPELHQVIAVKASTASEKAIGVGQKFCL